MRYIHFLCFYIHAAFNLEKIFTWSIFIHVKMLKCVLLCLYHNQFFCVKLVFLFNLTKLLWKHFFIIFRFLIFFSIFICSILLFYIKKKRIIVMIKEAKYEFRRIISKWNLISVKYLKNYITNVTQNTFCKKKGKKKV